MNATQIQRSLALCAISPLLVTLVGCQSARIQREFVGPLERAHNLDAWHQTEALHMTATVNFGSNPPFVADFIIETNGPRVRMEYPDGTLVIYDGKEAYISPADAEKRGARFQVLTWPWFLISPFKLGGADVRLTLLDEDRLWLRGEACPVIKETFAPTAGDAPDDWYILFMDPTSHRLKAQAYIVTYSTPAEQAEQSPHLILYDDYELVDGIALSTAWSFWNWTRERGVFGPPLGHATIGELRFVPLAADTFRVPDDAKLLPLPGAASR